jgi:hypothetical protein
MTQISFPNLDAKRKALGRLAGRFPFKSWATGEMIVPETALSYLAAEGISFLVEGQSSQQAGCGPESNGDPDASSAR